MANPPIIVRKRPAEGDANVNPLDPIRFGIRDTETRAALESVYTAVAYARAVYLPSALPTDDEYLKSEDIGTTFSIFNDAAGAVLPKDPCDQTIETVGVDEVYRIERPTAGAHEGFLYMDDDAHGAQPYAAQIALDLGVTSFGPSSYTTFTDFTGVVFGFIYWPESTGLFLFFRDDGVTKRITIAGPSADGIGTRPISVDVVFDWSAEIYTYQIWFDVRQKALVMATDSAGVETVLAEIDITTLNAFLPSVILGEYSAGEPPNKVVMVWGTDGPTAGDQLDTYNAKLFRYGKPLIIQGVRTGSSILMRTPIDSLLTESLGQVEDNWDQEGTGDLVPRGVTFALERTEPPVDVYRMTRPEPDLSRQEWMVIARLEGGEQVHDGSYNTSMGIDIEDGTNRFAVRFLDDFIETTVGLYDSGSIGDTASYLTPGTFDWTDDFQMVFLGSASHGDVRLFLNEDADPTVQLGAYASSWLSSLSRVSAGFLDDDQLYLGSLRFSWLWFFPNCRFYEGSEGSFPEVQGWVRTSLGGSRAVADGRLEVDATVVGDYDIYYFEDPDYVEDSGLTLLLRLQVLGWTSADGASAPPNSEVGPAAFLLTESAGVQLYFVESTAGTQYVFLRHDADDIGKVLTQTEEGVRISAEVNFREEHVYLLVVKPFHHIRLYIDYDTVPAIDVPWNSRSLVLGGIPPQVPGTAIGAFGSLMDTQGIQAKTAFARFSVGTGYDLQALVTFDNPTLVEHVYGSAAAILIDFEDVDP